MAIRTLMEFNRQHPGMIEALQASLPAPAIGLPAAGTAAASA